MRRTGTPSPSENYTVSVFHDGADKVSTGLTKQSRQLGVASLNRQTAINANDENYGMELKAVA